LIFFRHFVSLHPRYNVSPLLLEETVFNSIIVRDVLRNDRADGLAVERWVTNNQSLYYHFGPQGEARQVTDGSGNIQLTYVFTAYGVPIASSGSAYNRHRYGGKYGYFTDIQGMILAWHRWYNPQALRWLNRDPISYDGGDNTYAYVGGNPVRFVDPSGLAWIYNGSSASQWYKPEDEEGGKMTQCLPGQVCNVDGIYGPTPPEGKCAEEGPVKVPDNCTGWIGADGKVKVVCAMPPRRVREFIKPGKSWKPKRLTPNDMKGDDFDNWHWPFARPRE
jgi:RHS repeat-associated protein